MKGADYIVIGAGIAGVSVTYELSAHGRVVLLEREDGAGYHTSGRSAALYRETHANETVRQLVKASRAFLEHPPSVFGNHALLRPRGALYVARADQTDRLHQVLWDMRTLAPDAYEMGFADATALIPALRAEYVAAALYDPTVMGIDTSRLLHGYLEGTRQRGGVINTNADVLALSHHGCNWHARTAVGEWAAPVVVNAAGAWCDVLAKRAGVRPIGLTSKRRTLIAFATPAGVDTTRWPVVAGIDGRFYVKSQGDQLLASPMDKTPVAPCDVQPSACDIALTVERLEAVTTLDARPISRSWAGLRNFVEDGLPVVGSDDAMDGFFWLAGQGGYGIQAAPGLARVAAGLLTTGRLPEDLADGGVEAQPLSVHRLQKRITRALPQAGD